MYKFITKNYIEILVTLIVATSFGFVLKFVDYHPFTFCLGIVYTYIVMLLFKGK